MIKYIMNDDVVFFPEKKKVISKKSGVEFTLFKSSAQCLELLLERQGQIVPHPELMVAGWGENAKRTVSNPAYYQSFVNLRNVLRKLGLPNNTLVTVRGKGVRFNVYVSVVKHDDNPHEQTEILRMDADEISINFHGDEGIDDATSAPLLTFEKSCHTTGTCQKLKGESFTEKIFKNNQKKVKYICISIMGLMFIISCLLYNISFKDEFFIEGYVHAQGTPPCYFFNSRNIENSFAMNFIREKGLICKKDIKYFISYFSTSPRLTVFTCGEDASMKCDSITYIVDKNEQK